MENAWVFPKKDYVKINVHAVHYNEPLPNGNDSGVGVVMRDDRGTVILLVSGSIERLTPKANALWAMLLGLRCGYYERKNQIQLETDMADAVKEWNDWRWWLDPHHSGVIQQLQQRSTDPNLSLDVNVCNSSENKLARFLAVDGARNRRNLVLFRRLTGRALELWSLDMGLGPMDKKFTMVEEEDHLGHDEEASDDNMRYGNMLIQDVASAAMGQQQ